MLIDRILNSEKIYSNSYFYMNEIMKDLLEAQYFVVDNVAEYIYRFDRDKIVIEDLPNLYPVFPKLWFEYSIPNIVQTQTLDGSPSSRPLKKIGVLMESVSSDFDVTGINIPSMAVKQLVTFIFWEDNQDIGLWSTMFSIWIDRVGKPIDIGGAYFTNKHFREDLPKSWYDRVFIASIPAYVSLNFLHCKNVRLLRIDANKKQQLKRQKEGKKELISYHTLFINPLKEILETKGNIHRNGIKKALHICRGHFKDFTDGKGLFGKYHGLYWWEANIRGTQPRIVLKDYNIKTMGADRDLPGLHLD